MSDKSIKKQSTIRLLMLLGIVILINIISVRVFFRIDLTKNNVYTLSDASKNLVSNLDDRITVKAYFTEDLPAPYNNNRRLLTDMLNDYRAYAGDNLFFEFINPNNETDQQELKRIGIPPVEIQAVKDDKVELKKAYMGLSFQYEDNHEVIPLINDMSNLEYEISAAIKRLSQKGKKRIGFTIGYGETNLRELKVAGPALQKMYELVPVDLSKPDAKIPDDISELMIIGPKLPFSDTAAFRIDQYLMGGGKIALFYGKLDIDPNLSNPQGQFIDANLDGVLAKYGIRVNPDVLVDNQNIQIRVSRQNGPMVISNYVRFPYIPLLSNFDENNIIVNRLNNVTMPFISSVDTSLASSVGIDAEVIAKTSDKAGRRTGQIVVDPFYQWSPTDFAEKNIPIAVIFKGSFKSAFTGTQFTPEQTSSPETQIIVVGSNQFILDPSLQINKENLTMLSNIVDYLSDDSGLITIRSKNVDVPPLEELSDGTRKFLKYGNMLVPPIIVILIGLFRWRKKQSIKKSIEAQLN